MENASYRPGIVVIGYECSGALRRRFQRLGYETYSFDLKPAEDGPVTDAYSADGLWLGRHMMGDLFAGLANMHGTDLWPTAAIFHPVCTYLTNAAAWAFGDGPYHQKVKAGTLVGAARRDARTAQLAEIERIDALGIDVKVIENPVGSLSSMWRKPTQVIQPYMFGDDASKATCLWIDGADPLPVPAEGTWFPPRMVPRERAMGRSDQIRGNVGPAELPRWSNQTDTGQNRLSPGENRAADRARTYPGLADHLTAHIAAEINRRLSP